MALFFLQRSLAESSSPSPPGRFEELVHYKQQDDSDREKVVDELTAEAQRLVSTTDVAFVVVYDACVLYPASIRDMLIRLTGESLLRLGLAKRGEAAFDDIDFEHTEYSGMRAYTQTRTALALLSINLDELLRTKGIRAFAVHPGPVPSNDLSAVAGGSGPSGQESNTVRRRECRSRVSSVRSALHRPRTRS